MWRRAPCTKHRKAKLFGNICYPQRQDFKATPINRKVWWFEEPPHPFFSVSCFFNLGWLHPLPDFCFLFQEELLLPCQFNPEAVKTVEGASSSVEFLMLTHSIITGSNIQYSLSLKQTFSSSAFFKWCLCACQHEPEWCICAPEIHKLDSEFTKKMGRDTQHYGMFNHFWPACTFVKAMWLCSPPASNSPANSTWSESLLFSP